MIKIIELRNDHRTKEFWKKCRKCGTTFTYQKEDIQLGLTEQKVVCPNCKKKNWASKIPNE